MSSWAELVLQAGATATPTTGTVNANPEGCMSGEGGPCTPTATPEANVTPPTAQATQTPGGPSPTAYVGSQTAVATATPQPTATPICTEQSPCYITSTYALGFGELGGLPVRPHLPVMEHAAVGALLGALIIWAIVLPHFLTAERVTASAGLLGAVLLVALTGQWLWAVGWLLLVVALVCVRIQQVLFGIGGGK